MKDAYGFLWPISAFSMSSITRSVDRDPGRTIPVQLVMVDEPSRELPVDASVLNGYLKYLGQDKMILAGRKWNADKFELKVPLYSPFLIWTSPEGLLLEFAVESKTENKTLGKEGMNLTRFQQWTEF